MADIEVKGIKGWKEDDRPREKCITKGVTSLSDAELIAVLIGSGTKTKSAVDLGREILKLAGNKFGGLSKMGIDELSSVSGIGVAKAVLLMCAFEISRRRMTEEALSGEKIESSRNAAEIFINMLADLRYEECWVLLLNNSNRVITRLKMSQGGVSQTLVDPKIVFKAVFQYMASGFILCHNHPSGSVEPSKSDELLTKQMSLAAKSMQIRMIDHIIVGGNSYFSFADAHLL